MMGGLLSMLNPNLRTQRGPKAYAPQTPPTMDQVFAQPPRQATLEEVMLGTGSYEAPSEPAAQRPNLPALSYDQWMGLAPHQKAVLERMASGGMPAAPLWNAPLNEPPPFRAPPGEGGRVNAVQHVDQEGRFADEQFGTPQRKMYGGTPGYSLGFGQGGGDPLAEAMGIAPDEFAAVGERQRAMRDSTGLGERMRALAGAPNEPAPFEGSIGKGAAFQAGESYKKDLGTTAGQDRLAARQRGKATRGERRDLINQRAIYGKDVRTMGRGPANARLMGVIGPDGQQPPPMTDGGGGDGGDQMTQQFLNSLPFDQRQMAGMFFVDPTQGQRMFDANAGWVDALGQYQQRTAEADKLSKEAQGLEILNKFAGVDDTVRARYDEDAKTAESWENYEARMKSLFGEIYNPGVAAAAWDKTGKEGGPLASTRGSGQASGDETLDDLLWWHPANLARKMGMKLRDAAANSYGSMVGER